MHYTYNEIVKCFKNQNLLVYKVFKAGFENIILCLYTWGACKKNLVHQHGMDGGENG
jgi:hypothetical protein